MTILKSHKQLAEHIAGKRVLHLNSLGKDSIATLHWLAAFAKPARIVSLNFDFLARHPADNAYWNYLKQRYPGVEFLRVPSAPELNKIVAGMFQSPIDVLTEFNDPDKWEYKEFDFDNHALSIADRLKCDFISVGHSRYESMTRATMFHKLGILQGRKIYPIGMFSKDQVMELLRSCGTKLHPVYAEAKSTLDRPSYYRMRASILKHPGYWETLKSVYPMIVLDKFRYEEMLHERE